MGYREYFFATIERAEGSPAPDWKAVLESLPGRGFGTNPKPGEVQPANALHHGMTVMIDAGGNARGRIWLPSDGPPNVVDGNAWFTHEFQVIADGPTPGSIVWAWEDKNGAPVRPFTADEQKPPASEPPHTPPPADAVLVALNEIKVRLASLAADVDDVKRRKAPEYEGRIGSERFGTSITFRPKP